MVKRGPDSYEQWKRVVIKKMPHLSKPQAIVLAMWSFGIVMTHCCGLSTIAAFIACLLEKNENTTRQILKDWYREHQDKNGRKRAEIEVSASFVPLLQWILSWWGTDEKSLVLAADASTLGERFTLLVVCVVYRGCGIPVAWKIFRGNEKGSWKPKWLELFKNLQQGIPADWLVLMTTDRGLYANWLYEAIQQVGWHPFMRINSQGFFQHQPKKAWKPLKGLIESVGLEFCGSVTCFKSNPIDCTLLGRWELGYADPWLIVTDLPPRQAEICWYGMRCWIECLFKDIKSGGFDWHHTRMTDPRRAERLWLAIAVATLWLVSVGGNCDANLSASGLKFVHPTSTSCDPISTPSEMTQAAQVSAIQDTSDEYSSDVGQTVRCLSCFRRGFITILAILVKGNSIALGQFIPDFSPAPG